MKIDQIGFPEAYIFAYVNSGYDSLSGQWNTLNCAAEIEKTNITHTTGGSNYNFTIIEAGFYVVDTSYKVEDSDQNNIRAIAFTVDGSIVARRDRSALEPGDQVHEFSYTTQLKLDVGDEVASQMYQDHGGTRGIEAGQTSSFFKMMRVR